MIEAPLGMTMKPLDCSSCGAPLELPRWPRTCRCAGCQKRAVSTQNAQKTRVRRRSARQIEGRSHTLRKSEARQVEGDLPEAEVAELLTRYPRPRTRSACIDAPRPCPYISCSNHLFADVTEAGNLKLNFPGLEIWELKETCALDVADRGPQTFDEIGVHLNVTHERVRQVEAVALAKVKKATSQ